MKNAKNKILNSDQGQQDPFAGQNLQQTVIICLGEFFAKGNPSDWNKNFAARMLKIFCKQDIK